MIASLVNSINLAFSGSSAITAMMADVSTATLMWLNLCINHSMACFECFAREVHGGTQRLWTSLLLALSLRSALRAAQNLH